MDFHIVETEEAAALLPDGCTICRTHQGPFAVARSVLFRVQTSEGAKDVRGPIGLCVGTGDDLGCARLMGVTAGGLGPGERRKLELARDNLRDRATFQEARADGAEANVAALRESHRILAGEGQRGELKPVA